MKLRSIAFGIVIGALLAGGLAFGVTEASATGSNVVYQACIKKGKLIDVGTSTPTCPSSATPASWNSQGGSQGFSVPNTGVVNPAPVSWSDLNTGFHTVISKSLPNGNYIVTAHVTLQQTSPTTLEQCQLVDGSATPVLYDRSWVTPSTNFSGTYYGDVSFTASMSSPGAAAVRCENQQMAFTTTAWGSLTAVQVSSVS